MTKAKMVGMVLGIVLGIVVALIPPPAALTVKAMWGLGIFTWAIIFLIFDVLPDFIVTTTMLCLWVLFGTVPFKTAFAFFSDPNWWIVVGAFGMGFAASKSGLLRRISLLIMKALPATFKGQAAALMGAGFVIAPLIPSFTAKAAVCAPLSLGISDAMGYKHKSRGAAGLFGANVLGFIASAPSFLSASYLSFMIVSLMPKDIQGQFHWMQWFMLMLPWTILVIIAGYLAVIFLYRPEEKDTLPAGYAVEQLKKMGPISRNEKVTLIILVLTLLFWMTEKLHGIPAAVVAVLAVVALLILKVYDRVEFRSGITWDALVFLGGVVGIGSVFPALKLDKWMGDMVAPYVMSLVSNPYIFVLGFAIVIMLLRLVILSQTATIAIFILMLTPLALQAGMSPWIIGIIVYAAGNTWTVFFQNTPYVAAFYATGGDFVNHSQMVKLSVAYMVICIVGLLICVPLWQMMGLIK
jgi:divalent anion:Na+ symporter, DASS family